MTATTDRLPSLGLMLHVHHCIKFSQPLYESTKAVRDNISQPTKQTDVATIGQKTDLNFPSSIEEGGFLIH